MKILFYGRLVEAAAEAERIVDLPSEIGDGESLRTWLGANDPFLLERLQDPSVRMIINDALVHGNPSLSQDDEVAFFPPVSGG